MRDGRVLIFTQIWLNDKIPDMAIQLQGLNAIHADKFLKDLQQWPVCQSTENGMQTQVISKHCLLLVEFMAVK